ncbi:hypothetical protein D3C76_1314520 [compost metagenome]
MGVDLHLDRPHGACLVIERGQGLAGDLHRSTGLLDLGVGFANLAVGLVQPGVERHLQRLGLLRLGINLGCPGLRFLGYLGGAIPTLKGRSQLTLGIVVPPSRVHRLNIGAHRGNRLIGVCLGLLHGLDLAGVLVHLGADGFDQ